MSKPETVIIDDVKYIRADRVAKDIGPKRIVVADRGWVFVGDCEDHEDGTVTIRNSRNIRKWGTTKGLGELADGPTSKTVYDSYGEVRCTPIIQINVNKGW